MLLLMFVTHFIHAQQARVICAICLAIYCLSFPAEVFAKKNDRHPLADIQQTIEHYIQAQFPDNFQLASLISKPDPHLRLKRCSQALEAFYPSGARKLGPTTIGVRCLGSAPWQIFISVQIKVFGPAVVSKRALPRGTVMHTSDLQIAKRELSSAMHGYYSSIKEVEGMELRYSLASGNIIGPKSLKPRHLVKRGDIVTILAETNGLHIRVKGKALMNGFRGQSIRIKNTRSDRVLQGEVISPRTVRVKL